MFLYGGPGSQQVKDSWGWTNYFWYQMLNQKGYIVACVDNRGTGGKGSEFKKIVGFIEYFFISIKAFKKDDKASSKVIEIYFSLISLFFRISKPFLKDINLKFSL